MKNNPFGALRALFCRGEGETLPGGVLRVLTHLAASFQAHEEGIVEHLQRISAFVRILATGMGLSEEEVLNLQYASIFHDVGMIDVPVELVGREGGLTPEEKERMHRHTELGASMLSYSGVPMLDLAAEIALSHHERFDGQGYPYALEGEAIPMSGRIVAVADVFDALTTERPHKPPYPDGIAFELIRGSAGQHFDPDVIDVFVANFQDLVHVRERLAGAEDDHTVSATLLPGPTSNPENSGFELSVRDRNEGQVYGAVQKGFFSCPMCKRLHRHGTTHCYGEPLRAIHKLSGRVIQDKYLLKAAAGSGGMGVVYEAVHTLVGRHVAIKFLDPKYAKDGPNLTRFFEEARVIAMVEHPNMVEVLDLDRTEDDIPFMVMEFLDGFDLADALYEHIRFSEATAASIAIAMLDTLSAVHAKNIVHRDLKPENIFFIQDGRRLKLLDFGISLLRHDDGTARRITAENRTLGTPAYMSPEQALGELVDHRSDLFTVGSVLYEMITGERPFQGPNSMQVMLAVSRNNYIPPVMVKGDVTPEAVHVIDRALRRKHDRFQSAEDFARALLPIAHRHPDYERNLILPFPGEPHHDG